MRSAQLRARRASARPCIDFTDLSHTSPFVSDRSARLPACSRDLSFPVFDADNHFYEPREALTKFLPDEFKNVIDYVDVRGRTKIVVRGQNVMLDFDLAELGEDRGEVELHRSLGNSQGA